MIHFGTQLGMPRNFYDVCGKLMPWSLIPGLLAIVYGTIGGLWFTPPDYQQGEAYRIIYVHVPCAMLSLLIYLAMAVFSGIFLIWRIKVADVLAYSIAPIGAFLTFAALVTGAIWGKPMWGTWWIWDARLTSELILLFLYLGYIGLYQAIPSQKAAAKMCAILAIIGALDIPVIHYSVYWWNTLHQGATISRLGAPAIDRSMYYPLFSMIIGFTLYVVALSCVRARTEIMRREQNNKWVRGLRG